MRKHENDSRINALPKFVTAYDSQGNKAVFPSWETVQFLKPLVSSFINNLPAFKTFIERTWPEIAQGLFNASPNVALIVNPEGMEYGAVNCMVYEITSKYKLKALSNFPKRDYAHFCFPGPLQKATKTALKWKPIASWKWFYLGKNMWASENHYLVKKTHRIMALSPDFKNATLEETIAWLMETEKVVTK